MDARLFDSVGRYFWLICLAISACRYYAAGRRVDAEEDVGESMRLERTKYIRLFTGASTLPWIVMGLGQLTGSTSSVWDYFRPQDINPFVLAFVGSVFALFNGHVVSVLFHEWCTEGN